MRLMVLLVGASLLANACSSKSDNDTKGCTATNCQAMLGSCNTELSDDPDYQWCISSTPAPPDGGTFAPDPSSCVQVCTAASEGVFVQCIATNAAQCSGAGAPPSLVDQCQAQQTASESIVESAKCNNACQVVRAECQGECPLTDFNSCYQCSLSCSLAGIECRDACPAELAHCTDGKKDDGEEGVDCGGDCGPCPEGDGCTANSGCVSGICSSGTCAAVEACAEATPPDAGEDAGIDGGPDAQGPSDWCPDNTCLYGTCR